MAAKTTKDNRINLAAVTVTESAANTQTSKKFDFPFSIMDKMGLVINRIEYWVGLSELNGSTDQVIVGLTTASALVAIANQADPALVDSISVTRYDTGVAATGHFWKNPIIKDFSDLPGGGLLVAPSPLYAMIQQAGAAGAGSAWIKLFYTYIQLSTDEYWELVESRRIITS